MDRHQLSNIIKHKASELGFTHCGISKAQPLDEEAHKLEKWLNQGMHGNMKWMENHFDLRIDPGKLVEGAKSIISFSLNYFPEKEIDLKISKYAYGRDYHKVMKKKLKRLTKELQELIGDFNGRAFVDSAPIMDKVWAQKSGLGWIGKNSNLISRKSGSFFFLAELVVDFELEYDAPATHDYCGTCTRCIDACPTDAIVAPFVVDGSKCISYYTIELKEQIPNEVKGKFEGWIFGCDTCQDVCPWNRFSKTHNETDFQPNDLLQKMTNNDLMEITEEVFDKVFLSSPIKRTKLEGIKRNVRFIEEE